MDEYRNIDRLIQSYTTPWGGRRINGPPHDYLRGREQEIGGLCTEM